MEPKNSLNLKMNKRKVGQNWPTTVDRVCKLWTATEGHYLAAHQAAYFVFFQGIFFLTPQAQRKYLYPALDEHYDHVILPVYEFSIKYKTFCSQNTVATVGWNETWRDSLCFLPITGTRGILPNTSAAALYSCYLLVEVKQIIFL